MRILPELNDVSPNPAENIYMRTPLPPVGYEEVVKMLQEPNNVNANTVSAMDGQTPLSWAARNGDEGVVRLLLERNDIDPNIADAQSGRTPLSLAAENGREGL